jgi:hypothetical protein
MSNDELKAILDTQYEKVRQLEDGTFIGIHNLMFTRALHIDLDIHGWSRRYCYADRDLADVAFNTMTTSDDQPLPGFVASRGT